MSCRFTVCNKRTPVGGMRSWGKPVRATGGREGTLHFLLNFAMNLLDFFFKAKEKNINAGNHKHCHWIVNGLN